MIVIPGEPCAQGRPKFSTHGGFARAYDPKKSADYKTLVKTIAFAKCPTIIFHGMVKVNIRAYFKIPASASIKKRKAYIDGIVRPTKKPDTDNIAKICLDSMNGIVYDDDKQIVSLTVEKYYSGNPRVEIEINEM